MRFCVVEREDFPEREFAVDGGVLMHYPPGGDPHPAADVGPANRPDVPFDASPPNAAPA